MRPCWILLLACLLGPVLPGCQRDTPSPASSAPTDTGAREPAEAVLLLTRHLRDNDLPAFARDAVPPALHRQLQAAWQQGHSRWPLDELPFDERLPALLGALAAPDAERKLQQVYDHQFSGETSALRAAATTLGLFGAQYVRQEGSFSDAERAHYLQFVQALSHWGATAPLGDPARARVAIPRLTAAARATGLASDADFARSGLDPGLQRLSGFLLAFKQVLDGYGLHLDDTLAGLQAQVLTRQGDTATVQMQYTLGGQAVTARIAVVQVDGRWYLNDYLRHARAAVAGSGPG